MGCYIECLLVNQGRLLVVICKLNALSPFCECERPMAKRSVEIVDIKRHTLRLRFAHYLISSAEVMDTSSQLLADRQQDDLTNDRTQILAPFM